MPGTVEHLFSYEVRRLHENTERQRISDAGREARMKAWRVGAACTLPAYSVHPRWG